MIQNPGVIKIKGYHHSPQDQRYSENLPVKYFRTIVPPSAAITETAIIILERQASLLPNLAKYIPIKKMGIRVTTIINESECQKGNENKTNNKTETEKFFQELILSIISFMQGAKIYNIHTALRYQLNPFPRLVRSCTQSKFPKIADHGIPRVKMTNMVQRESTHQ